MPTMVIDDGRRRARGLLRYEDMFRENCSSLVVLLMNKEGADIQYSVSSSKSRRVLAHIVLGAPDCLTAELRHYDSQLTPLPRARS